MIFTFSIFQRCKFQRSKFESLRYAVSSTIQISTNREEYTIFLQPRSGRNAPISFDIWWTLISGTVDADPEYFTEENPVDETRDAVWQEMKK